MKILLILMLTTFIGLTLTNSTKMFEIQESEPLESLNIDFQLRGYFYAGTSIEDSSAWGHSISNNYPKEILSENKFKGNDLFFEIDTINEYPIERKYKGRKVYLINRSQEIKALEAQDGRLNIVCEADSNGKWVAIEYLPQSWCGNSYHRVSINPNGYWEFLSPIYDGSIQTQIRYKLIKGESEIVSIPVNSCINIGQFGVKQGYTPKNIMDPYFE